MYQLIPLTVSALLQEADKNNQQQPWGICKVLLATVYTTNLIIVTHSTTHAFGTISLATSTQGEIHQTLLLTTATQSLCI